MILAISGETHDNRTRPFLPRGDKGLLSFVCDPLAFLGLGHEDGCVRIMEESMERGG